MGGKGMERTKQVKGHMDWMISSNILTTGVPRGKKKQKQYLKKQWPKIFQVYER